MGRGVSKVAQPNRHRRAQTRERTTGLPAAQASKVPFALSQAGREPALKPLDLVEAARGLTELSPRRPSQANLRRAVSTAYYALFHCLAACAANSLIGRTRDAAWHQTYRALEHGKARTACENKPALAAFRPEVRRFADTFAALQKARQKADYALDGKYEKAGVRATIDTVEDTIASFEQVDARHRRAFIAQVLFKRRP